MGASSRAKASGRVRVRSKEKPKLHQRISLKERTMGSRPGGSQKTGELGEIKW